MTRVFVVGPSSTAVATQIAALYEVVWCPSPRWANALTRLIKSGAGALVTHCVALQVFTLLYGAPWDDACCQVLLREAFPTAVWIDTNVGPPRDGFLPLDMLMAYVPRRQEASPRVLPCSCTAVAVFEPRQTWATEHVKNSYSMLDCCMYHTNTDKALLLYVDDACLSGSSPGLESRSIALLVEPPGIQRSTIENLTRNPHTTFHGGVFIHGEVSDDMNEHVVGNVPFGTCWCTEEQSAQASRAPKTPVASLVASSKSFLQGHALRHAVIKWAQTHQRADLVPLGHGYAPITLKSQAHDVYMYSVVIENERSPGWWTEKLVDCAACRCVALYWGAPNINTWFDMGSVLTWSTIDELGVLLDMMSIEDYESRAQALNNNAERAAVYSSCFTLLALHSDILSRPDVQYVSGEEVGCPKCSPAADAATRMDEASPSHSASDQACP